MASWTGVAASWGGLAIFIVLGWYYYRNDGGQLKRLGKQRVNESIVDAVEELAPKGLSKKQKKKTAKKNESIAQPESQAVTKSTAPVKVPETGLQKRKDAKTGKAAQSSAVDTAPTTSGKVSKETDTDAQEFARQMAKAQAGTSISSASKENQRVRTQKQSKMNGNVRSDSTNGDVLHSGASSNTGGDADDDLSPANSPEITATTSPADTAGIADMLESAGPGAATLRITEPLVPVKAKKPQAKKQEVVETKKQRQNRLKREREKEANREAEAQRRVLEEKQRRTAREAEGRPAKNGNGWTYDSGLPANAWTSGKSTAKPAPVVNGGLLDTTEEPQQPPTIVDEAPKKVDTGRTNGVNGTANNWKKDLPSEEEQMRLIQEQSEESEWTTVTQPKRAKRKEQAAV